MTEKKNFVNKLLSSCLKYYRSFWTSKTLCLDRTWLYGAMLSPKEDLNGQNYINMYKTTVYWPSGQTWSNECFAFPKNGLKEEEEFKFYKTLYDNEWGLVIFGVKQNCWIVFRNFVRTFMTLIILQMTYKKVHFFCRKMSVQFKIFKFEVQF